MRSLTLIVVLLLLAAGFWTFQARSATARSMAIRAKALQQAIPTRLATGAGVEFAPGTGPVDSVLYGAHGVQMELDAGEGRGIDRSAIRTYRENNGVIGLQLPGDSVIGTFSNGPSTGTQPKRYDVLQSTFGFGGASLKERPHLLASCAVRDGGTASFVLGPGIALTDPDAGAWQLLVQETGGIALHWRNTDALEIRATPTAAAPLTSATATVNDQEFGFVQADGSWLARIPTTALRDPVRVAAEVSADGALRVALRRPE